MGDKPRQRIESQCVKILKLSTEPGSLMETSWRSHPVGPKEALLSQVEKDRGMHVLNTQFNALDISFLTKASTKEVDPMGNRRFGEEGILGWGTFRAFTSLHTGNQRQPSMSYERQIKTEGGSHK